MLELLSISQDEASILLSCSLAEFEHLVPNLFPEKL